MNSEVIQLIQKIERLNYPNLSPLVEQLKVKLSCCSQLWQHERTQMQQYTDILQKQILMRNNKIDELVRNRHNQKNPYKQMISSCNSSTSSHNNTNSKSILFTQQTEALQNFTYNLSQKSHYMKAIQYLQQINYKLPVNSQTSILLDWFQKSHKAKDYQIHKLYEYIIKRSLRKYPSLGNLISLIKKQFEGYEQSLIKCNETIQQLNGNITQLVAQLTRKQIIYSQITSKQYSCSKNYQDSILENINIMNSDNKNQNLNKYKIQVIKLKQQLALIKNTQTKNRKQHTEHSTFRQCQQWQTIGLHDYSKIQKQIIQQLNLLTILKSDLSLITKFIFTARNHQAPNIRNLQDIRKYLQSSNQDIELILSIIEHMAKSQCKYNSFNKSQQNYLKFKNKIQNLVKGIDDMVTNQRLSNTMHQQANLQIIQRIFIQVRQIQSLIQNQYNRKQQNTQSTNNNNIVLMLKQMLKEEEYKTVNTTAVSYQNYEEQILKQQNEIKNLHIKINLLSQQIQKNKQQYQKTLQLNTQTYKNKIKQKQGMCTVLSQRLAELRYNNQTLKDKLKLSQREVLKSQQKYIELQKELNNIMNQRQQMIYEIQQMKTRFNKQKACLLSQVQKTSQKLQYIERLADRRFEVRNRKQNVPRSVNMNNKAKHI